MTFQFSKALATMPLPTIAITSAAVAILGLGASVVFQAAGLLAGGNFLFILMPAVLVAYVSGRSFLATRNVNLLYMGTAVLEFGVSAFLGGIVSAQDPVEGVSLFLLGGMLAGALHLSSAVLTFFSPQTKRSKARLRLAICYIATIIFLTIISLTALFGQFPGGLLLLGSEFKRTALLFSGGLFLAAAFLFYRVYARAKSSVLYWYSPRLLLWECHSLSSIGTRPSGI